MAGELLIDFLRTEDHLEDVLLEVKGLILVQPSDGGQVDGGEISFLVDVGAEVLEVQILSGKPIMIQNLFFLNVKLLLEQFDDLGLLLLMFLAKGGQGDLRGLRQVDRRDFESLEKSVALVDWDAVFIVLAE